MKSNYGRIQSAVKDLQSALKSRNSAAETETSVTRAIEEACRQFKRQMSFNSLQVSHATPIKFFFLFLNYISESDGFYWIVLFVWWKPILPLIFFISSLASLEWMNLLTIKTETLNIDLDRTMSNFKAESSSFNTDLTFHYLNIDKSIYMYYDLLVYF